MSTPPPRPCTTASPTSRTWATSARRAAGGHWDAGATGTVGDWFTGTNRVDDREWQTRSQVDAADRGREFAFVVGGAEDGWVRWGYLLSARGGGTDVTETWQVLRIVPHMGESDEQLAALRERTVWEFAGNS